MTGSRGRPKSDKDSKLPPPAAPGKRPSQAPSGVFRTSNDGQRWGQRLWRDGWMVAEQFVREGFYYQLLRRPVGSKRVSPRLTKREEDVLNLARAGHNNKSIAQLLDVSASTVGVLLFRAAAKLNVASRSDLIAAYDKLLAQPQPSEPPEPSVEAPPKRPKR